MKFVCDKCSTKYSIPDERVAGKVLKIRCKHCSNLMTVAEARDGNAESVRPTPPPPPDDPTPLVTPPAPEAWFVSFAGKQEGPFSLEQAKAWVRQQPVGAIHCWSEGFSEWLPIEKVGQFRAVRQSIPPMPPRGPAHPTTPPVNDAFSAMAAPKLTAPQIAAEPPPADDLSFGEVSRVVNLADLARQQALDAQRKRTPLKMSAVAPPPDTEDGVPATADPATSLPIAEQSKSYTLLIAAASVLVLGLIGGLVVMAMRSNSAEGTFELESGRGALGQREIDPARIRQEAEKANKGGRRSTSTSAGGGQAAQGTEKPANGNAGPANGLAALEAAEVEAMSNKMQSGITRCREQAQKKNPFLDVKKLKAIVTVTAAGGVSNVTFTHDGKDDASALTDCVKARMMSWKFRPSSEGIVSQLTFVFRDN